MKWSVCYGYSPVDGRAEAFYKAAEGWVHWYGGKRDIEFCIVLDVRTRGIPSAALDLLWPHFDVRTEWARQWTRCSSHAVNQAVAMSTGERVILSSPECMLNSDALADFDRAYALDPNGYHVGTVAQADKDGRFFEPWLQHPRHNPRGLHFFSTMSRSTWDRVGGMDEKYGRGLFYEDNDFLQRVKAHGITVNQLDAPNGLSHAIHMHHDRGYQANETLVDKNRSLYVAKERTPNGFCKA